MVLAPRQGANENESESPVVAPPATIFGSLRDRKNTLCRLANPHKTAPRAVETSGRWERPEGPAALGAAGLRSWSLRDRKNTLCRLANPQNRSARRGNIGTMGKARRAGGARGGGAAFLVPEGPQMVAGGATTGSNGIIPTAPWRGARIGRISGCGRFGGFSRPAAELPVARQGQGC
jgi:hypothetical protein